MPSPVEALPCGSRSTMSTVSPTAASAVPRLMAVVVLPTPPFWFASAKIRGAAACGRSFSAKDTVGLLHHEDHATGIGRARDAFDMHFPRFGGFGQFRIHILSLMKIAYGPIFQETLGIIEELGERRKRSRRDRLGPDRFGNGPRLFDPHRVNLDADPR